MIKHGPLHGKRRLFMWVILFVTLMFGLHPKDYRLRNSVAQSATGGALEFARYGVAFTPRMLTPTHGLRFDERGFTMVFLLDRPEEEQEGFAFLAQVHSGDDASQLVIGRWSDYLIVMNGDDYKNRLRHPRLGGKLPAGTNGVDWIAVSSSAEGTQMYFNGERVARDEDVVLSIPTAPRPGRLVLGNSVRGTQSWRGAIREFTLFDKVLTDTEVQAEFGSSPEHDRGMRSSVALDRMLVRYRMGEHSGGRVINDFSGQLSSSDLVVPTRRVVVDPGILRWPFNHQFEFNRSFLSDMVINLFGFVPLGFVLACAGVRLRKMSSFISCVVVAAIVSLGLELFQAWLPSRDSSALDLALNTLGGAVGVMFASRWMNGPFAFRAKGSATSISPD